jgi:hypothetical protein
MIFFRQPRQVLVCPTLVTTVIAIASILTCVSSVSRRPLLSIIILENLIIAVAIVTRYTGSMNA